MPLAVTEHARTIAMRCLRREDTGFVCRWRQRADSIRRQDHAFVIYLLPYQLLSEDRLAELMADLFGVKLAAATIARMSRTCALHITLIIFAN